MENDPGKKEPVITSILGKPISWYAILQVDEEDLNDLELMLKQDMQIR